MSALISNKREPTDPMGPHSPTPALPDGSFGSGFAAAGAARERSSLVSVFAALAIHFSPCSDAASPEAIRRAQLIVGFGLLGGFFGLLYALFYLAIGHYMGCAVIFACTAGVIATPFVMKRFRSVAIAGHLFSLILLLGFTTLCLVEGGMRGHAVGWLASIPLCALLLVHRTAARRWALVTFTSTAMIVGVDLLGYTVPVTYPQEWHGVVTGAGYLGLLAFMFMLGQIFENGRARAFTAMETTLRQLAASNERLVQLNQEKTEFLGIAAHDLKNPLTAVIGYAELLQDSLPPERTAALAGKIAAAGVRMRHLITNLLDANAIEEGQYTSNLIRCAVSDLVRECLDHNRETAQRKRIELKQTGALDAFVRADRDALMQILDNLISNAIKYSPPGGEVCVDVRHDSNSEVVHVIDRGPGISEMDQKRLFQKYARLTARPTAGESSNGLGLSIVKRLAEAMAGSVHCQSRLGHGSTFSLRLPVWPADSSESLPLAA